MLLSCTEAPDWWWWWCGAEPFDDMSRIKSCRRPGGVESSWVGSRRLCSRMSAIPVVRKEGNKTEQSNRNMSLAEPLFLFLSFGAPQM